MPPSRGNTKGDKLTSVILSPANLKGGKWSLKIPWDNTSQRLCSSMEGSLADEMDPPEYSGVVPCLAGTLSHPKKNTTRAFQLMVPGQPEECKSRYTKVIMDIMNFIIHELELLSQPAVSKAIAEAIYTNY